MSAGPATAIELVLECSSSSVLNAYWAAGAESMGIFRFFSGLGRSVLVQGKEALSIVNFKSGSDSYEDSGP